jgi:hypothetical protein
MTDPSSPNTRLKFYLLQFEYVIVDIKNWRDMVMRREVWQGLLRKAKAFLGCRASDDFERVHTVPFMGGVATNPRAATVVYLYRTGRALYSSSGTGERRKNRVCRILKTYD